MVLVEHVGRPGLHLGLQNAEPQDLGLHRLPALALRFQPCVHSLKLLAPNIHQSLACALVEGLVGAEEGPVLVLLHALHEEVRDPKTVEKVAGTLLLFAMVLPQLEELKDVCMPGLQVHGEGALPLATALVDVARGLIEVPEHGDEAVAVAVGAPDVRAACADVRDSHANPARRLGDQSALLQGVVNAVDAVPLHLQQKAR
mmetsp:Transcript_15041/g.28232  ORF Transcript_15041/g.28232 Transcript_15041/m.28232 type:complete len:201 (+) Transcript_15041:1285-1887(+)